jgi:arylsulfatase A-like enzyme
MPYNATSAARENLHLIPRIMIKLLLIFLSATSGAALLAEPGQRPNVVVLLADDAGWGDFGFTGNTNLDTPHIDRLAREGAIFDRFYVAPVCVPTRAEFLTGRYYLRTGVRGLNGGKERIALDEKTIADAFQTAGYATGAFGKWHNGSQGPYHPNARGFDEFYGFTTGHWGHYFDAPLDHNGRPVRGQGYIVDDLTDHALAFIEQNRHRPFFCYVPFNTPHSPFCVPDEYWNRFEGRPMVLRANPGDNEDLTTTRCALAMCENLDWNVGRILRKLTALGLEENTIVIFLSDNGPNTWRWNGGLKGRKGSVDEGGVRAPFAIRWPRRISPGLRVPEMAAAIDLLPTLMQLAGVPRAGAKPLDGRDLSPLLFERPDDWPDRRIFSHVSWSGRIGVRTQRYLSDGRGGLFDLIVDPGQHHDLAAQEPGVVAELARAIDDWRTDVFNGGPAPTQLPDDRPFPVGYAAIPITSLPAADGVPRGGVQRSAKAPNSSFFTHWTNPDDAITWNIEVLRTGGYAVTLYYTCPAADTGSTVELEFNDATVSGRVELAWDPPLITKEDRVPRSTESYMKEFRPLDLGIIHLRSGQGLLTVRATRIPGAQVMDLSGITLTLLD